MKEEIQRLSRGVVDPAGRQVRVVLDQDILDLAHRFQCHPGDLYRAALEIDVWPYRYIRNRDLYSRDDQLKLARSCVAVIGCGGLGGTVTLLLARSGIGSLILVDYDVFDETNLNRQALSSMEALGRSKAETGSDIVSSINPSVKVRVEKRRVDEKSARDILPDTDVVVDALDNIQDRLTLEKAARELKKPFVHGALGGFNGQVMTVFPEDPGLELIYSGATEERKTRNPEALRGVPAVTPSVVASFQTMEVIKILLGRGRLLREKFMYFDLESSRFHIMDFKMPGE